METLIILVGAIIMLSVAFYLARSRSYIPPKTQTTKEEESIETFVVETPVVESPREIPQKTAATEKTEQAKITETKIKEEITPEEKASSAEPAAIATPKKEPETNVAKQSETGTGKKVYTIQVGAFSNEKNALNLAKEIKNKGYHTYVVKGKTLYKVQVEEFKTYQEAQNITSKLKTLGYPTFITTK